MRAPRQQLISAKMKVWHPWQLKKSKSWGPFWSYQLNSTANSAPWPILLGKWAGLAVLFSWQLQNGPQDFYFFDCHGCQTFILAEMPAFFMRNNSFIVTVFSNSPQIKFYILILGSHIRLFFLSKNGNQCKVKISFFGQK